MTRYELKFQLSNNSEIDAGVLEIPDGKSAYNYAQESGYTGTEAKYSEDMNPDNIKENAESFIIDELAKRGQIKPEFANDISECTDTTKLYVLPDGYIYAYMKSTSERVKTITDNIIGTTDNPYSPNSRFSSSGTPSTQSGYTITPYIDLTKAEYQGKTIQIHLDGNRYACETQENYIMCAYFDTAKNVIVARTYTMLDTSGNCLLTGFDNAGMTLEIHSQTSATLTFPVPLVDDNSKSVGYMRFCGSGSATNSVYITYQITETVTAEQWSSLGIQFVVGGIDDETLAKISALNNEGASPSTIKLLPSNVLDFYNKPAYSDNDYTTSHLANVTYPFRADIPVPYTVKWEHNENAMRTMVAVDTKVIGTLNRFTMRVHDATGVDNYPIYNLLPNTRYYYKVTHIMADGSIIEAKSGSFATSNEPWRLIYIDGTQNVRDLGGWTGLNGKRVKYGQIFRGAAFSDSSYPEFLLTGKGRRSLGDLKIQAELNLGAADTETSVSATCAYHKVGYSNYATAFTDATAKANFKNVLEKIVGWLSESTPRNIYMHCQGGCDRTGTLSFQLLGLLGVSESDLAKEYELSSFSDVGFGRLRTTTKAVNTYDYVGMVEALKTYSGNTITDKFVSFATACGVTSDTITSFRNLMLG